MTPKFAPPLAKSSQHGFYQARDALFRGRRARGFRENQDVRWLLCGVRVRPTAARATPRRQNR